MATEVAERYGIPFVTGSVANELTERGLKHTFQVSPKAGMFGHMQVDTLAWLGEAPSNLEFLGAKDYFTPPASGSFPHDGMVIHDENVPVYGRNLGKQRPGSGICGGLGNVVRLLGDRRGAGHEDGRGRPAPDAHRAGERHLAEEGVIE